MRVVVARAAAALCDAEVIVKSSSTEGCTVLSDTEREVVCCVTEGKRERRMLGSASASLDARDE